jgi:hypothetical protein
VPGTVTPPTPDRANAVVTVDYACPGTPRELVLRDDLSDALGSDYHTLVRVEALGSVQQYTLEPDRREARVAVATPTGGGAPEVTAGSGVFAFFRLGIEHILTGVDHLLFVLALVLGGGGIGSLFAVVTAFTVAHSITLSLAALNIVSPPARLIEPAIALSIVYVGADNILAKGGRDVRVWIAFTFGFIHGFGFANVLREMELPARALGWSLFSFNFGVEIGQLLVVVLVASALAVLRQRSEWAGRHLAFAGSIVVMAAGAFWFVQRVFFPGGIS